MASYLLVRCAAIFLCMQVTIAASESQTDCQGECQSVKTGAALLQVTSRVVASPIAVASSRLILEVQKAQEAKYAVALASNSTDMIAHVIQTIVEKLGGVVVNKHRLNTFAGLHHQNGVAEATDDHTATRTMFFAMLEELRAVSKREGGWLQLPPPEKSPLLWSMIRADPWNCEIMEKNDPRFATCKHELGHKALDPKTMNCSGEEKFCNIEHANAFRTLQEIGALPCCPTPPYCAAPACAAKQDDPSTSAVCTKRSPEENLAYLKDPDVWPAFHGWGGANELDTLKLIDALGRNGKNSAKEPLFDLMMDFGANTGYYTEKLTVRNFAKHYVMIEANPGTKQILDNRWGNKTWMQTWFTKQIPADPAPTFQVINMALSNHSEGTLDMCQTEPSFLGSGDCNVAIASVDKLVPGELTKEFQEHFHEAKSAFIKIDTEGMDELVLRGMKKLLKEKRGKYEDGSPRYLVNFFQFEWSPHLSDLARVREDFQEYDIKTVTQFLEKMGFETFLIGPRFLPLSHGSYDDEFKTFANDPNNNAGVRTNYPNFDDRLCKGCNTLDHETFTGDVFAIRASHPRLTELKLALGACKESKDFDMKDAQYSFEKKNAKTI